MSVRCIIRNPGRGGSASSRCGIRSRRVTLLLIGIVLLSAADLLLTITHLQNAGMAESNPIAAFLIRSTESPWVLAAYKSVTVAIAVSLLYRLRRHLEGEIGAWCGMIILVTLALVWGRYAAELEDVDQVQLAQIARYGDGWLRLE